MAKIYDYPHLAQYVNQCVADLYKAALLSLETCVFNAEIYIFHLPLLIVLVKHIYIPHICICYEVRLCVIIQKSYFSFVL